MQQGQSHICNRLIQEGLRTETFSTMTTPRRGTPWIRTPTMFCPQWPMGVVHCKGVAETAESRSIQKSFSISLCKRDKPQTSFNLSCMNHLSLMLISCRRPYYQSKTSYSLIWAVWNPWTRKDSKGWAVMKYTSTTKISNRRVHPKSTWQISTVFIKIIMLLSHTLIFSQIIMTLY